MALAALGATFGLLFLAFGSCSGSKANGRRRRGPQRSEDTRATASGLTGYAVLFGAIYLLAHGLVKVVLVVALLLNKMWAYPWMIAVLLAFIGYQLYRIILSPTPGLVALKPAMCDCPPPSRSSQARTSTVMSGRTSCLISRLLPAVADEPGELGVVEGGPGNVAIIHSRVPYLPAHRGAGRSCLHPLRAAPPARRVESHRAAPNRRITKPGGLLRLWDIAYHFTPDQAQERFEMWCSTAGEGLSVELACARELVRCIAEGRPLD